MDGVPSKPERSGGATRDAEPSPGWYPDPAGRHHFRFWDGTRWSDLVSTGGVTGTDPPGEPQRPAAAPGPDALVLTAREDGGFRLTTTAGADLAAAEPSSDGETILRRTDGSVATTLHTRTRQVVVVRDGDGAELGRFEPPPAGGLRMVSRGALAGNLVSWPDGTLGLVDPEGAALARYTFAEASTTIETAPGIAPALAQLAALLPMAMAVANRLPAKPEGWAPSDEGRP